MNSSERAACAEAQAALMAPVGRMGWFGRFVVNLRTRRRARALLREFAGKLELPPGAKLLELGGGGGGLVIEAVERLRPSLYVGTDVDPTQIETARGAVLRHFGAMPGEVQLTTMDARSIPYPDGSFDAVFALMMLHHVEDRHGEFVRRPEVLREIRRVLRPGGVLVYSDFDALDRLRGTVTELGFRPIGVRRGWRHETGAYRAPPS